MSYEVRGKFLKKGEIETFNTFSKRAIVAETLEQYPQKLELELHQDRVDILDVYELGQELIFSVDLRGREWTSPLGETKYFNTLVCWKVRKPESE